ncbi:phage tail assembly chaperone [Pseudomonas muyukensis]|uniref:Phage tail assembly chaperone n=2 Tax=Pseudomonas muyukensis TaxID=2842357 RepID=A0ABX8MF84_9PSED|nr:phage tail assembly chaperone [Pseudomonas muyukensis]
MYYLNLGEVEENDERYVSFIRRMNIVNAVGAVSAERGWRDKMLAGAVWLRDRHRDQLEIGATTTLTADQFAELLVFMQALRDWPQSEAFPDVSARPVPPAFLEQSGGDQ